jgi:cytosine/uracil/thiamine/allantoin permease
MREFLKFLLIWISQNLAIPFWMVGHIHLSMNMNIYQDLHIILASLGMNIIVAIGFWVDYKSQKDK